MKKTRISSLIAALFFMVMGGELSGAYAQEGFRPDKTVSYAQKDGVDLLMDIYYPADGSEGTYRGMQKPTIVYMFGGGFKGGVRNDATSRRWFKQITDEGYSVVSIDYRLGLKNATKAGVAQAGMIYDAIQLAVEDLYSATRYMIDNAEELDIDPYNLVISGSSAGAISAMQAEWELCNRSEAAGILPEDFRYAGVMSFAGAVFSKKGGVKYKREPAPILMFHGTDDKIVNYNQIHVLHLSFEGDGRLSKRFKNKGFNYNIYRYEGNGHEIAMVMSTTLPEQLRFLETNVMSKNRRIVDTSINDPSIKGLSIKNRKDLYGGGN